MVDRPSARPDITLTIDREGVIQTAVSAEALADETLENWHGRPWEETIAPEIGREVSKIIDQAQSGGDSFCFRVNQRFPSGREFPIEYTTISLGADSGFIAVGRNLQTIADLQRRLHSAQQEREQDYWKLREIETRYRAVLDASEEAVVLVRATNLRVVETNAAATKAFGLVPGVEFQPAMSANDQRAFAATLENVRNHGRSPSIALRLTADASHWSLRASLINTAAGSFYFLQLAPLGRRVDASAPPEKLAIEEIVRRLPDAFVVIDRDAIVRWANYTFLDLAQIGVETAAVGQDLRRWLSKPGADVGVIMGLVQRHGSVRLLRTSIEGELGSSVEVEISATGELSGRAGHVGLLMRDVSPRLGAAAGEQAAGEAKAVDVDSGGALDKLVKASVEDLERRQIVDALAKSNGNRTQAAKYLGVSRQTLHAKLNRYSLARN
jgi:transcriptional regulator PpsR